MGANRTPFWAVMVVGLVAFTAGLLTAVSLHLPPFSVATTEETLNPGDPRLLSQAFVKVAKDVGPTVVNIDVVIEKNTTGFGDGFDFFGAPQGDFFGSPNDMPFQMQPFNKHSNPQKYQSLGSGSGVIMSEDGYILTNNHVVRDAKNITVKLQDKRQFKAKVIGSDPKSDLALIKIDATGLPAIKIGDSDKLMVGEWVVAVGNPFGLTNTVTAGIISAVGRSNVGLADYEDYIQTDASINPGNSGGALVNLDGELIGINTAIASRSGGSEGIGFAIPVNMAKSIMEQLKSKGSVERAWIGVNIQQITPDLAEKLGLSSTEGSLVSDVVAGSPAEKAGLHSGDVIVSVDGQPMPDTSTLRNHISTSTIGKTINLTVMRSGSKMEIKVTLSKLPSDFTKTEFNSEDNSSSESSTESEWGFSVTKVEPGQAEQLRLPKNTIGLVITDVQSGSAAMMSGLRPGDAIISVDNQTVTSISDLQAKLQGKDKVLLVVKTGKATRYLVLKK